MNEMTGTIETIESHGKLSLCQIKVGGAICHVLVIDRPETVTYLREGIAVSLIVKETQVVLSLTPLSKSSMMNCFEVSISNLERGKLFTRVHMSLQGFSVTALILTRSVTHMPLEIGTEAYASIRSNEIMLSQR